MIKKYIEFLEEMRLDKNKYVIVLTYSDLNVDHEFYSTIGKYDLEKQPNYSVMTVQRVCDYIRKTSERNNLHFDRYWSGWLTSPLIAPSSIYETKFYGNKSDLEKINKYYGITDNTLREPTETEKTSLWRNLGVQELGSIDSDFLTYIDGTKF